MTNGITKDSYMKMANASKLNVLFDMITDVHYRLEKIEKRKSWDLKISAMAGFFGGAAVVLGKMLF